MDDYLLFDMKYIIYEMLIGILSFCDLYGLVTGVLNDVEGSCYLKRVSHSIYNGSQAILCRIIKFIHDATSDGEVLIMGRLTVLTLFV